MAVRIGSGRLRGRVIETPPGKGTRPPLALQRKSLFDILAPRLAGARVLDVYAGSGSFGFEAVSRGAEMVVMVEADDGAFKVMRGNAERLGVVEETDLLHQDAESALESLARGKARYDVVFLDPPFREQPGARLLELAGDLVEGEGMLVLRVPAETPLPAIGGGPALRREKVYGASRVGFYVKEEGK